MRARRTAAARGMSQNDKLLTTSYGALKRSDDKLSLEARALPTVNCKTAFRAHCFHKNTPTRHLPVHGLQLARSDAQTVTKELAHAPSSMHRWKERQQ